MNFHIFIIVNVSCCFLQFNSIDELFVNCSNEKNIVSIYQLITRKIIYVYNYTIPFFEVAFSIFTFHRRIICILGFCQELSIYFFHLLWFFIICFFNMEPSIITTDIFPYSKKKLQGRNSLILIYLYIHGRLLVIVNKNNMSKQPKHVGRRNEWKKEETYSFRSVHLSAMWWYSWI